MPRGSATRGAPRARDIAQLRRNSSLQFKRKKHKPAAGWGPSQLGAPLGAAPRPPRPPRPPTSAGRGSPAGQTMSQQVIRRLALLLLLAAAAGQPAICDSQPASASLQTDLEPSGPQAEQPAAEGAAEPPAGPAGQERFVAHPGDAWALVGQAQVSFSCLVANKRSDINWFKGDIDFVARERRVFLHRERISTEMSQLATEWGAGAGNSSLGEPNQADELAGPGQPLTNYTLHIHDVELSDQNRYYCKLFGTPYIKSSAGRLTVLQAPSKLEILARQQLEPGPAEAGAAPDRDQWPASEMMNLAPAAGSSWAQADQQQQPDESPISRLVVIQNRRLRLECRANQARPHAELVWLDAERRPVPRLAGPDEEPAGAGANASQATHFAEQTVQLDADSGPLELTSLSWSFRVTGDHHNQVLTCQARHKAFELMGAAVAANDSRAPLYRQQLAQVREQRLVLDVQHEPVIELTYQAAERPQEFRPIRFLCRARARPNELRYRWFVDRQLVENATRPVLQVSSLGRQLHMREIRCQVSNAIGSSVASLTLPVRYSPAFVGHLGGAHRLQPGPGQQRLASPISGQLALGYVKGQNVTLSCEFDSNPKPDRIRWEKINTDYNVMANVSSERADDLIAFGGSQITIFKAPQVYQLRESSAEPPPPGPQAGDQHAQQHRRYIAGPRNHNHERLARDPPDGSRSVGAEQLDYEQMSESLQAELARLRELQPLHNASNPLVEELTGDFQTPFATLDEPLGWQLRPRLQHYGAGGAASASRRTNYRLLPSTHHTDHHKGPGQPLEEPNEDEEPDEELVLLDQFNLVEQANYKLRQRQAVIQSSSIRLTGTNVESMGRYVCTALTAAGSGLRPMSRSIYLVPMERPRIISIKNQSAALGAAKIECLAQIHTVNDTQIKWFKNGQLIDVMHRSPAKPEKKFYIYEQRSPDLLFMRSILMVNNSDLDDFGRYECQVNNSFFTDHTSIYLTPLQAPGLTFRLLACLTVGSMILFSAVVSVFISLTSPFRRFGSLTKTITVIKPTTKDKLANGAGAHPSGQRRLDDGLAAQQLSPGAQMLAGEQLAAGKQHPCFLPPPHLHQSRQAPAPDYRYGAHVAPESQASCRPASAASTTMMMMINNQNHHNQLVGSAAPSRPESALAYDPAISRRLESSSAPNGPATAVSHRQHHQSFRSSLRQPAGYSNGSRLAAANGCQQLAASKRFAAIHESLEHKLQFGQPQLASNRHQQQPAAYESARNMTDSSSPGSCHKLDTSQGPADNDWDKPKLTTNMVDQLALEHGGAKTDDHSTKAVQPAQTTTRLRLIDRIWSKLRQGGTNGRAQSRCSKANGKRPTISLPVELTNGGQTSNGCNSSLSNSRTTINSASDATSSLALHSADSAAPNLQLLRNQRLARHQQLDQQHHHQEPHYQHHHQVSSSQANLIQDCATGSDQGSTPTHGVGSSNTSSGRSSQLGSAVNHHFADNTNANNANLTGQHQTAGYPSQQQDWLQLRQHGLDAQALYANGGQLDGSGPVLYHQQSPGVWASTLMTTNPVAGSQLEHDHQNHQQQATPAYGHYQMPMQMNEPLAQYVGAANMPMVQQHQLAGSQEARSCYATICAKPAQLTVPSELGIYGTVGPSISQQQQAYQAAGAMIPTSHDNDAFFESNYGTLLASAYKSLGYAQPTTANGSNSTNSTHSSTMQANDSNSSSPNSLTTHANISSQNNLSSREQHQQPPLAGANLAKSAPNAGTYLVYNPISQHLMSSEENNDCDSNGAGFLGQAEPSQHQSVASSSQHQADASIATVIANNVKSSPSSGATMKNDGIATHV